VSARLPEIRAIEARRALVQWLHEEPIRRARARDRLKAMPDIGRALARLALLVSLSGFIELPLAGSRAL